MDGGTGTNIGYSDAEYNWLGGSWSDSYGSGSNTVEVLTKLVLAVLRLILMVMLTQLKLRLMLVSATALRAVVSSRLVQIPMRMNLHSIML